MALSRRTDGFPDLCSGWELLDHGIGDEALTDAAQR
jgi:hypothetical protein